jgi:HEPN domain-containing protein
MVPILFEGSYTTMSQRNDGNYGMPYDENEDDIERLLTEGVTLHNALESPASPPIPREEDDDEVRNTPLKGDLQGALALFAEASQDMATAGVELSLGRHFACVDYCNQAVEKAAQAVSLLRFGRPSMYDHDLRALGAKVGAPPAIQDEMARLTPFHPETFYADTPPEEADEVISAEQASGYVQSARTVLRWARNIVLRA